MWHIHVYNERNVTLCVCVVLCVIAIRQPLMTISSLLAMEYAYIDHFTVEPQPTTLTTINPKERNFHAVVGCVSIDIMCNKMYNCYTKDLIEYIRKAVTILASGVRYQAQWGFQWMDSVPMTC